MNKKEISDIVSRIIKRNYPVVKLTKDGEIHKDHLLSLKYDIKKETGMQENDFDLKVDAKKGNLILVIKK